MKHFLEGPGRDMNLALMTWGHYIFLALGVLQQESRRAYRGLSSDQSRETFSAS